MLNILFTGPVMNGKTIAGVWMTMRVLYCTPYDYSIIILDILATMGKISRISLWGQERDSDWHYYAGPGTPYSILGMVLRTKKEGLMRDLARQPLHRSIPYWHEPLRPLSAEQKLHQPWRPLT